MTIEFNVSEEDYVNFNLYHIKHSKSLKIFMMASRYGIAISLLILYIILPSISADQEAYIVSMFLAGILVILWIAFFPKIYTKMVKYLLKKQLREGRNNDFGDQVKFTLREDCIEVISNNATTCIKYTAIERIMQVNDYIYVYVGAINAYIIPISCFTGIEHKNQFISLLEQKAEIQE